MTRRPAATATGVRGRGRPGKRKAAVSSLPLVAKAALAAVLMFSMGRAFVGPPAVEPRRAVARTLLAITALCLPALSFAQEKKPVTETVKENIKESVITTKIKAEYARDKQVSFRHIHVDTDDKNVVTLSGNAKSKAEMNKAVKIAKSTLEAT